MITALRRRNLVRPVYGSFVLCLAALLFGVEFYGPLVADVLTDAHRLRTGPERRAPRRPSVARRANPALT